MSLFRPWIGPVEGDPNSIGRPNMELALSLPDGHPSGFRPCAIPEDELNSCHRKSSSTNGSAESCKSFYSYYYQYYYSQLIYYASMQQQQQQQQQQPSSSAPINSKATNCRAPPPQSIRAALHRMTKPANMTTSDGNNNNRNNANNSSETNERLHQPLHYHKLPQPSSNRSQTESQSLDSSPTTSRNLSSETNKRACEMGNQSSSTMLLSRTSANLSSDKRSDSIECRSATDSTSAILNSCSTELARPVAKTPSIADLQNILTFQNLFLDSLAAKKRAAKTAADQRPKKFICTECKSGFSNRSQLNSHIRTHTGERPFVCDYKNCQKSFTRNEELTRHRRIHSGIRPYPCRWCDKRFGRKDHLRKHERTHERRLRSTILLNYTANLTSGQLFGSSAIPGSPLGSSRSPSSVSSSSSSSADLLAKVQASAFGLMQQQPLPSKPPAHNHKAAISNSASSISSVDLCSGSITRQQAVPPLAPKMFT